MLHKKSFLPFSLFIFLSFVLVGCFEYKDKVADELGDHLKFRFVIETDGEITESNARDHTAHRAVWRFDGGDLLKPEGLDMRLTWK